MAEVPKYRMDKTAFRIRTFEEADNAARDYSVFPVMERLRIAWHLTSIAYQFDIDNPPRMDKSYFRIKKHDN